MTVRPECSRIEIDVLYFEDCPNHLPTMHRISAVLREEGCVADVREVLVAAVGETDVRSISSRDAFR
jgi:hypothetical protein